MIHKFRTHLPQWKEVLLNLYRILRLLGTPAPRKHPRLFFFLRIRLLLLAPLLGFLLAYLISKNFR